MTEQEFEFGDYDVDDETDFLPAEKALDYYDVAAQDDPEGLGAPGNALRTPREALRLAAEMAHNRVYVGVGYCLKTVRGYYGVGAKYGTATQSWIAADHKRPVQSGIDVPRGVPVYWTGGAHGYGHIALSVGGGLCWSTDWAEPGRIALARIDDITQRWNLNFQGYAWEVNDVIVWKPPTPTGAVKLHNLHKGAKNADVKKVKQRLSAKGYKGMSLSSDKFGFGLQRAYKKYQQKLGYSGADANGIPGPTSLRKLGFKVTS